RAAVDAERHGVVDVREHEQGARLGAADRVRVALLPVGAGPQVQTAARRTAGLDAKGVPAAARAHGPAPGRNPVMDMASAKRDPVRCMTSGSETEMAKNPARILTENWTAI